MLRKLLNLFKTEYVVVIWYDPSKKSEYRFKKIKKIDSKEISAVTVDGQKFDLKVNDSFNYQITKVH